MAKKRKTRSQKIAADLKHPAPSANVLPSSTYSLSDIRPQVSTTVTPISKPVNPTTDYQFVRHDLIKTSSITGAIILAELVLFFLLK